MATKASNKIQQSQLTKNLGVTGLSIWRGVLAEEYLPALKGTRAYKVFQEMAEDTVIATLMDALKMPLLAAEFSVVAASEDTRDTEIADFIWECMNSMTRYTWRQHILDCLSMLTYGWSVSEITLRKREDGRLVIDILDPRDQNTLSEWKMDENGWVEAMKQLDPIKGKVYELPEWKLVHMTFRPTKRNPEGTSPMRSLYRDWYMRKNIEVMEAIGIERDAAGLPVLKLPYGANEDSKAEAVKVIKSLRNDEEAGVVLPPPPSADPQAQKWELALLSGGAKAYNARETIRDYNKQILMRFFAQFLALGMEQAGTQALVKGSQDFFSLALKSLQQEMLEAWNNQLVPLLIKVNNLESPNGMPLIDWADPGKTDLVGLSQLLRDLTGANIITPDNAIEDQVRALAGLPDRTEGTKQMRRHRKKFGGEGSGNWGHEGRPGEVGGSGEGGVGGAMPSGGSGEGGDEPSGKGKKPPSGSGNPSGSDWHNSLNEPEKDRLGEWQGSGYDKIRAAEVGKGSATDISRAKAFNAVLDKDGQYKGVTYRGLNNLDDDSYNSLMNSEEIEWKSSSSATKSKEMADAFATGRKNNIVFRVNGKTGVDISSIPEVEGGIKEEQEVILRKGTKYAVKGKVDMGHYTYINLEEK